MKKFRFTLQTVLNLNISLEKEEKNQLAAANRRIMVLEDEKAAVIDKITASEDEYSLKIKCCSVEDMKIQNVYIANLNITKKQIDERIDEEKKKRQKIRDALSKTIIKRKSLETLMEKQYTEYLAQVKSEEEKSLDDFVSYSYLYS